MRRRAFLAAAAGACFPASVPGAPALTEIRTYHRCAPGFRDALEHCLAAAGIDAERTSLAPPTYRCLFANQAERAAAWARVNTLPEWPKIARGYGRYEFVLHA